MKKFLHLPLLLISVLLFIFTSACGGSTNGTNTLVVAIPTSPASLDGDLITPQIVNDIMSHVYEGLFEFNAKHQVTPHLAESYEILDEGRTYVINLRRGVNFHDGSTMTSDDVIASFGRWITMNGAGRRLEPFLESFTATGEYQVTIRFTEPYAPFLQIISANVSNQKLMIRPRSLVEAYPDSELGRHIGTGPYKFVEFLPDQHILLSRFDDYSPSSGAVSGMAGNRTGITEQIKFAVVSEQAVQIAGVQSGEYHFALDIPSDQYTILAGDNRVQTFIISPSSQLFLILNQGGLNLHDIKVRQAIQIGLDLEELAGLAVGNRDFWSLNPSLFHPDTPWHYPNAGAGLYNVANVELARQLLAESSYDGSPIVILNQREPLVFPQTAIALQSQLEAIGFNVELQLLDTATVMERRSHSDTWDIHVSAFRSPDPDPQVYGAWMGTNRWIGNWDDEYSVMMDDIFDRMLREIDPAARLEIVREWQRFFYETVPYVKVVDFYNLIIASPAVSGYAAFSSPFFWNVSIS